MINKTPKKSKATLAQIKVKNFIQGGVTGYTKPKTTSAAKPRKKK